MIHPIIKALHAVDRGLGGAADFDSLRRDVNRIDALIKAHLGGDVETLKRDVKRHEDMLLKLLKRLKLLEDDIEAHLGVKLGER